MAIKASEISDLIKARIENFSSATEEANIGTVVTVTDGIVRVHGLADVKYGEMLEFPGGSFGLALNLEQDSVGAVVLGEYKHITEGDTVKTTGTSRMRPVVFTVSPSVMCLYSPSTTAPTESCSRFSARPKLPPGNSSISPYFTSASP